MRSSLLPHAVNRNKIITSCPAIFINYNFVRKDMRITGSVVITLFVCSLSARAQSTKEIPLKPIYKNGGKYFYGDQRMNSVYALQIPLQSLNDNEINARYKKFKTYQALRVVAYIPGLVYLLTNANFGGRRP